VRAGTEGFVEQVLVSEGARVRRGDLLIILRDPELSSQIETLVARVGELQARYDEAWAACDCPLKNPAEREASRDLVKAEMINEELRYARRSLERARERARDLAVRSASDGTFVVPPGDSLQDRFFKQGELLAHVIELSKITVRAVVSQADMDLVQSRTRQVQVRLAEHLSDPIPAAIKRIVPAASEELPSTALGSEGGGEIAVSALDSRGLTAVQKIFQIDLEVPSLSGVVNVGGRAHIRFDHGWETLAVRCYRWVRLVFLSQFSV
jgi:putative peptide zinc metalloprotease protein